MSFITKMLGVDKVVSAQINQLLEGKTIPNVMFNPRLLEYRSMEYKVWASSNPNNLLTFYKTSQEPTTHAQRLMFWQWVGGVNVPKVHYPSTEIILNYTKGILFSGGVSITATKGVEAEDIKFNKRIDKIKKDINFDDFCHNGSLYESYSGSLAVKFVLDKEVHDKPILELYPKERFELVTKYGKIQEYRFIDSYWTDSKEYQLISYYGKGYIRYKLFLKGKNVPLSTLDETRDLQDMAFNPKIILAAFKKNKTVSNEFTELPYGGSDFEGVTDIFHSIDEVFSTLMLYIRRSRPIMGIDESLLPVKRDGSATVMPKEYEFDAIKLRNNETNKDKLYRDNPEIKTDAYMDSIKGLMLSIYQKIGISYSTADDTGIGANASGESIAKREKTTTIMRDSKIKLWIPFIEEVFRLYMICDDFMTNNIITRLYDDWNWLIEFAEYNGQSFAEKVEELGKAKREGLIDTALAMEKLYPNLKEEELKELTRNAKIESGAVLFEEEL